ncbi:chemotaxis response regulator protein-glutamate methylesterase [Plasticicumulans sp.]|uniref:protein-glutamate methylesterase/protein-glutamine glutaminase n=1 Tax=Plasticicumulans sp. TaxID=2307179 RepID=UPI0039520B71
MDRIRILIVDDAVVVRRMLSTLLAEDPELEVVGTAVNGADALRKIPDLRPHLLILDVDMPEMNGLETLTVLGREHPRLPVIMFSNLTRRGAQTTLEALALGAKDYVTKPESVGSAGEALEQVRAALVPKIKALCRPWEPAPAVLARRSHEPPAARQAPPSAPAPAPAAPVSPAAHASAPPLPSPVLAPMTRRGGIELVVIGCSTGGPNALATLVAALPRGLAVPVVVVQHMPPVFTRMLAERLDALSPLSVREGSDGARIQPGEIWIAPGDFHMTVRRSADGLHLGLNQGAPENSCRPAVDVLLRSAVAACGARVLGVILTGMGHDGLASSMRLREAGGQLLAQDERSSVVWGMPGNVVRAGLADRVLAIEDIGPEIAARVRGEGGRHGC